MQRRLWRLIVGLPSMCAFTVFFLLLGGASCSGSGGGSNAGTTSFQVSSLSVQEGAIWQLNREITLTFTEPVDFSTVSSNTINIRSTGNVPATGVFRLRDPNTVVFQPTCPTLDDFSDAGLQPGGVTYVLRVAGLNSSANTVRSISGVPVGLQQSRTFSTPASTQAAVAFRDTARGAPSPILRPVPESNAAGSYLEVGSDADLDGSPDRVYFLPDDAIDPVPGADQDGDGVVDDLFDENGNPIPDGRDDDADPELSDQGFRVPLNLYSDQLTRVAIVIEFNQPVNPSSSNISKNRLRLEYMDASGDWTPIDTRVTLVRNCTETGATVRLEPIGVLPSSSSFRAVVLPGFQDLIGETTSDDDSPSFAQAPTRSVAFTSLEPASLLSDEMSESYEFGGDSPLSFQDTTALFDTPVGEWGEGRLSAAFSFEGTGGPNGTFDWVVRTGEIFFFDTTNTPIIGGPNGIPTTTLNAVNGIVDVHSLIIEAGGEVRVQGPNPMFINATGDVIIRGKLDVSGFNAKDVATLNTGNQVEVGGAGTAGGGKGGNANDNISGPTPRGGRGQGPFRQANLGGDGGEMGYAPQASKNARRPGGGGGGRFAKDWSGTQMFTTGFGVAASRGNPGNNSSIGAISGRTPSAGGAPGQGAFLDASDENDYFGVRPIVEGGILSRLVRGELPRLWAGYGGGGGGNAGRSYPNPAWNANSDEKGGGGGGGAGGLRIRALGRIVFGAQGQILANGGRGATGENTNFLDHIGGTGGGGSGGHVILESASIVDFTDGGAAIASPARDIVMAAGPVLRPGPLGDVDACCKANSNGGAGGAGVIQIHVPDPISEIGTPQADILVPTAVLGAVNVIDQVTSPPAYTMIPTFGARSKVRSKWISIGGADERLDGSEGLVRFLFEGIEKSGPNAGKIKTIGSTVMDLPPLVQGSVDSNSAQIITEGEAAGFQFELKGSALDTIRSGATSEISNDIYLRTPSLLADCALRLRVASTPANFEDFTIARAAYNEGDTGLGDETLTLTVTMERGRLDAFSPGSANEFLLLPRFFRVVTNGLPDSLPATAFVRLRFQAAQDNGIGAPDEANPLVNPGGDGWTSDIAEFNEISPGLLQFFRYEVEFDLDAQGNGVRADTEPVTLDFLKIPFVF